MKLGKLLEVDTTDLKDEDLARWLALSHRAVLIMSLIGVVYTVLSLVFFPYAAIWASLVVVGGAAYFLMVHLFNWTNFPRIFFPVFTILMVGIYHAYLVQPGEDIYIPLYSGQFAVSAMPWVMMSIKEKKLLVPTLIIIYAILFYQPWMNEALHHSMDTKILYSGSFIYVTFTFSIAFLSILLVSMDNLNRQAELENRKLTENMISQNMQVEHQQKELENTLEEMNKAREEEKINNWITHNLNKVNQELKERDLDDLYKSLAFTISEILNAPQVGLYQLQSVNQEEQFVLRALYAFDRFKYLKISIDSDEGLFAKCLHDKEVIQINNLPKNYIKFRSGLGNDQLTNIFISPILYDDQVTGIIEILSQRELKAHEKSFLEQISSNIGAFLTMQQTNETTKSMVNASKTQAEMMHAQEEEMRQNIEELQATQEGMERKEKEYEAIIAYLKKELEELKTI